MAAKAFYLFTLIVNFALCMEMRETVERMVMVRTTGSDLQPAATGFIYKRNSDGPAKVIKMAEDEILEQLKKIPDTVYEQPKAFAAPIPVAAGPFYGKEEYENRAASESNEEYVKPVVEDTEETKEQEVDGIADDEYAKIISEYAKNYGNYKNNYGDYSHGLGKYGSDHGKSSDYGNEGHSEKGDKIRKEYATSHKYGKGDAGDYHTEKHQSYSTSAGNGANKVNDDSFSSKKGSSYTSDNADTADKTEDNNEEANKHEELHKADDLEKDKDLYDSDGIAGQLKGFADGYFDFGSDAGRYQKTGAGEPGHDEDGFGESGFDHNEDGTEYGDRYIGNGDTYSDDFLKDFSSSYHDGKSYGYKIKH